MDRNVQAFSLLRLINAQAHGHVDDLKNEVSRHHGPDAYGHHADGLDSKRLADGEARGKPEAAEGCGGEDRGQENAQHAAHTVHGEDIEGVVDLELLPDQYLLLDRPGADEAGKEADGEGADGTHKAGRRV